MWVAKHPKVNRIAVLTLREVTVCRCEPALAKQLGRFNEISNYKEYWLHGGETIRPLKTQEGFMAERIFKLRCAAFYQLDKAKEVLRGERD